MAYTTIDDPSAYFQTKIYTGNGGALAVTNDGNSDLQPDLAWFKKRGGSESHALFDTSRGIDRFVSSNSDAVEQHQPTTGNTDADDIASFDSDGFTFQGGGGAINQSSNTYVAWQWKANGGTRTTNTESGNNPAGGYQANTTAGFSIVDYTGTGAAGTMAHGLGAVPTCMIIKNRSESVDWGVYHQEMSSAGNDSYLELNTTDAVATAGTMWNDTTPTSSVFTIGSNTKTNKDAITYIAYVFTPIQGYSKFGSYTGNGNADGPFVYLGFKPAWIMIKHTTETNGEWMQFDNKRQGYNDNNDELHANDSDAEVTGNDRLDLLSNGIKIDSTGSYVNTDGDSYIYIAFAESPFVSSEGVPTTAR